MAGSQSASALVSIISPLLGLALVALVFWVDSISGTASNEFIIPIAFVFGLSWVLGIYLLWKAVDQYLAAGVFSGGTHTLALAFLTAISVIVLLLLFSGYYYS
jgi:hypothetical protein